MLQAAHPSADELTRRQSVLEQKRELKTYFFFPNIIHTLPGTLSHEAISHIYPKETIPTEPKAKRLRHIAHGSPASHTLPQKNDQPEGASLILLCLGFLIFKYSQESISPYKSHLAPLTD